MKVGIDVIELERLKEISENKTKLSKIFTVNEIEYFNKFSEKLSHIAGFFCAKEAFVKAFGTGFGENVSPLDIEILHEDSGKPFVNLLSAKLLNSLNQNKIEISISHSKTIATAICIIF